MYIIGLLFLFTYSVSLSFRIKRMEEEIHMLNHIIMYRTSKIKLFDKE